MKTKKITIIEARGLTWHNLDKPTETEYQYLKENFSFHPLDIHDCISPIQRPEINEYIHYIFLILRIPYYNKDEQVINALEIDIFIGQDFLVTVNQGESTTFHEFLEECQRYLEIREKYFQFGPAFLLYEIMNRMFHRCYPLLDLIANDIDRIERKMFKDREREVVEIIADVKRNVINFRKIMRAHQQVINKLIKSDKYFLSLSSVNFNHKSILFDDILEEIRNINDILEGHVETIDALEATNENLISNRLNEIMKTLTIVSSVLLPAALITQIFGMSYDNAPLLTNRIGFISVFVLIFLTPLTLIIFFKKKKWL